MSNPSLDDVFKIDQLLHQLASYEVTGGKILMPASLEEAYNLQKKTADKFNYFKALIQRGECSIDFIKNQVLRKNGPFISSPRVSVDNPDLMEKIMSWEKEEQENTPEDADFIKMLLKTFSNEMPESERESFLNKLFNKPTTKPQDIDPTFPPSSDPMKNNSKNKKRKKLK